MTSRRLPAHGPESNDRSMDTLPTRHWQRVIPLLLIVVALAIGYGLGWHQYLTLEQLTSSRQVLKDTAEQQFFAAIALYILAYGLAVTISFPATWVLTVLGGFVFGSVIGGAATSIAATMGATAIFWATRTAFGDFLRKRVSGTAARLAGGFERDAFGFLLALRLVPVIPFFVLNITPALFRVGLGTFVAATFLGILPGTFVYAYLGQSLDGVVQAAQRAGRAPTVQDIFTPEIAIAFAALAALAIVPILIRKFRPSSRTGA